MSGGCLGGVWAGVWGVSARCQGRLVVSGGVRRCFGGALDTFSDLGTGQINLKMCKSIQKSLKLIQLSKIILIGVKIRLLVYLNPLGTFCLGADTIFQSSPCKLIRPRVCNFTEIRHKMQFGRSLLI